MMPVEGLPEWHVKVDVPYCYTARVEHSAVFLERNPFFGQCDESKVRFIIVECRGKVRVYKNGRLLKELPCESLPR